HYGPEDVHGRLPPKVGAPKAARAEGTSIRRRPPVGSLKLGSWRTPTGHPHASSCKKVLGADVRHPGSWCAEDTKKDSAIRRPPPHRSSSRQRGWASRQGIRSKRLGDGWH